MQASVCGLKIRPSTGSPRRHRCWWYLGRGEGPIEPDIKLLAAILSRIEYRGSTQRSVAVYYLLFPCRIHKLPRFRGYDAFVGLLVYRWCHGHYWPYPRAYYRSTTSSAKFNRTGLKQRGAVRRGGSGPQVNPNGAGIDLVL